MPGILNLLAHSQNSHSLPPLILLEGSSLEGKNQKSEGYERLGVVHTVRRQWGPSKLLLSMAGSGLMMSGSALPAVPCPAEAVSSLDL